MVWRVQRQKGVCSFLSLLDTVFYGGCLECHYTLSNRVNSRYVILQMTWQHIQIPCILKKHILQNKTKEHIQSLSRTLQRHQRRLTSRKTFNFGRLPCITPCAFENVHQQNTHILVEFLYMIFWFYMYSECHILQYNRYVTGDSPLNYSFEAAPPS